MGRSQGIASGWSKKLAFGNYEQCLPGSGRVPVRSAHGLRLFLLLMISPVAVLWVCCIFLALSCPQVLLDLFYPHLHIKYMRILCLLRNGSGYLSHSLFVLNCVLSVKKISSWCAGHTYFFQDPIIFHT